MKITTTRPDGTSTTVALDVEQIARRADAIRAQDAGLPVPAATNCKHGESLYGRCTNCGMTWEEQA